MRGLQPLDLLARALDGLPGLAECGLPGLGLCLSSKRGLCLRSLQLPDELVLPLRGVFLRLLRERWEAAGDEAGREAMTRAARWGLAALDGGEEAEDI